MGKSEKNGGEGGRSRGKRHRMKHRNRILFCGPQNSFSAPQVVARPPAQARGAKAKRVHSLRALMTSTRSQSRKGRQPSRACKVGAGFWAYDESSPVVPRDIIFGPLKGDRATGAVIWLHGLDDTGGVGFFAADRTLAARIITVDGTTSCVGRYPTPYPTPLDEEFDNAAGFAANIHNNGTRSGSRALPSTFSGFSGLKKKCCLCSLEHVLHSVLPVPPGGQRPAPALPARLGRGLCALAAAVAAAGAPEER